MKMLFTTASVEMPKNTMGTYTYHHHSLTACAHAQVKIQPDPVGPISGKTAKLICLLAKRHLHAAPETHTNTSACILLLDETLSLDVAYAYFLSTSYRLFSALTSMLHFCAQCPVLIWYLLFCAYLSVLTTLCWPKLVQISLFLLL